MMKKITRLLLSAFSIASAACSSHAPPVESTIPEVSPRIVQGGSNGGWESFSLPFAAASVVAGHDGAMWASMESGNLIARIDMAGNALTYPLGGTEYGGPIARNQDGNVYVAEQLGGGYALARVTPTGVVTDIPLPAGGEPISLVSANDGSIWMTRFNPAGLGRLAANGVYTDFTGDISFAYAVAIGPDKNVWATVAIGGVETVARFLVADGSRTTYSIPSEPGFQRISQGADGGIWVPQGDRMVRVDPTTGVVTTYPINNGSVYAISDGPGKKLYINLARKLFEYNPIRHEISARISYPSGFIPIDAAIGPDSQLWVSCTCLNVDVLILHQIQTVPTSVTVSVGASTGLAVSEPKSFQKNFNAVSNNQSVATVSGSGKSFTVTGVAHGNTTITVSDQIGNSLDVPVTVN